MGFGAQGRTRKDVEARNVTAGLARLGNGVGQGPRWHRRVNQREISEAGVIHLARYAFTIQL